MGEVTGGGGRGCGWEGGKWRRVGCKGVAGVGGRERWGGLKKTKKKGKKGLIEG